MREAGCRDEEIRVWGLGIRELGFRDKGIRV